jgi:ubiquinone/menaquinone biosynthesis C-methylase UbiE
MKWRKYWSEYPKRFARTDYFRQTKLTIGGRPISDDEWQSLVETVLAELDLKSDDLLLDLCCGNGVLTYRLAQHCRAVVAVDFSSPLIAIARTDHARENIAYIEADVRSLASLPEVQSRRFDRVLISAGLQYFSATDLPGLIQAISPLLSDSGFSLFTAILNIHKKRLFYNTPGRRFRHLLARLRRQDEMGTRWDPAYIQRVVRKEGLECEVLSGEGQYPCTFRFDLRIWPPNR